MGDPSQRIRRSLSSRLRRWKYGRCVQGGFTAAALRPARKERLGALQEHKESTCSAHLFLVEHTFSESHRHIEHRHHLHDLGLAHAHSVNAAHRTRSRGIRCRLVSGSADVFASVGADGSVRVFDLRSLEHSTIIYEDWDSTRRDRITSRHQHVDIFQGDFDTQRAGRPSTQDRLQPMGRQLPGHLSPRVRLGADLGRQGTRSPILELARPLCSGQCYRMGPPSVGAGVLGPSKGMVCSAADDAQVLVYDLASTTLRTASAQGRRSRNGHAPSPAPGSMGYSHSTSSFGGTASPAPTASLAGSIGIGAEIPFPRLHHPESGDGGGSSGSKERSAGVERVHSGQQRRVALPGFAPHDSDWIALAAGNSVRALKPRMGDSTPAEADSWLNGEYNLSIPGHTLEEPRGIESAAPSFYLSLSSLFCAVVLGIAKLDRLGSQTRMRPAWTR
ncbi:hypothetical protein L1887_48900 [Cichorium endivia]|nr:hypothetical protein L1887_48900 [Cichorium endivia]